LFTLRLWAADYDGSFLAAVCRRQDRSGGQPRSR